MIELDGDQLLFRFPEVHADALCRIEFQRTLISPKRRPTTPSCESFGRFATVTGKRRFGLMRVRR